MLPCVDWCTVIALAFNPMTSHSRGRVTALSMPLAMAALAYAVGLPPWRARGRGADGTRDRARCRRRQRHRLQRNGAPSASATRARRFEPDPCRDRKRGDACSTELAPDGFCSEAYSAADVENAASSSNLFCKRKGPVRGPFALRAAWV